MSLTPGGSDRSGARGPMRCIAALAYRPGWATQGHTAVSASDRVALRRRRKGHGQGSIVADVSSALTRPECHSSTQVRSCPMWLVSDKAAWLHTHTGRAFEHLDIRGNVVRPEVPGRRRLRRRTGWISVLPLESLWNAVQPPSSRTYELRLRVRPRLAGAVGPLAPLDQQEVARRE